MKKTEEKSSNSSCQEEEKKKRKEAAISCMLNTEIGAVLAVIRRPSDLISTPTPFEPDANLLQSLKSLRPLIFKSQQEWRTVDPAIYLSPFLDVIQSDDVPAAATGIALSAVSKMLNLQMFDEKTPGAREAINSLVLTGITGVRLEKTDALSEEAILMRILQVLASIMKHQASIHLTDNAICTLVNTCFQVRECKEMLTVKNPIMVRVRIIHSLVITMIRSAPLQKLALLVVQQSATRGDLLQRSARHTMHELIQVIFSKLPDVEVTNSDSEEEDDFVPEVGRREELGYGVRCAEDIFHFLCSLLNVAEVVESEGSFYEDLQLFALVMINSAIELSGDTIGRHPKLLRMVKDDLFHHLIHYGTRSRPLVLALICSTVLNVYQFLRQFIRLQLEAFFEHVLLKVASMGGSIQLQEVALEAIINFCRQPAFIVEAYVNYDCDPLCHNIFEEIGKLLCRRSFPGATPLPSMQMQAFEGMAIMINNIADNINKEGDSTPSGPYPVEITEYRPFWEEKPKEDFENWVEYLRFRKAQKRKLLIAANHFNRDEKRGLEYLKIRSLVTDPPDPKAYATFFRFMPGLDKTLIGERLGDPDELYLKVLQEFAGTFEFSGMALDNALRTYLATFRLPGESQKIQRIVEAFSEKFYDQIHSDIFASKDTVLILSYSLIMLNTDQHNKQVKKKMTEEDFIKNNRSINGGKDLPREYLSEVFHSIATKEITFTGQTGTEVEMTPGRWIELMNRSKLGQPFILCNFDRRLGRDMFACIAGPAVAALSASFENADEDEMFHECIGGLISIARIARYGLEDTLDELIATFSKFTTLLNPYATAEETLFGFTNDTKPRMATLAVFTIANSFSESIREGWRSIIDCLLKLKRLKLLPQSVIESDSNSTSSDAEHVRTESGIIFPSQDPKFGSRHNDGMISRFSHFLSLERKEDMVSLGMSEFEQNLKVIKQCRIGSLFSNSSKIPEDSLLNLGRSLIFAAGGKGQKFSTPLEEEETVTFCWDLITTIALTNTHRFQNFWPAFHDYLLGVAQFPLFSPVPFAEKAIVGLFKVSLKLLSSPNTDKLSEEVIFKSINLMWKLDKDILEMCCESITKSVSKILVEYSANLQTPMGWKSLLHLLSVTGRHPENYDQGVETLITFMSDQTNLSEINYIYCIDCAFGFIALRNSPLEKNLKILDLLADTVNSLIQWFKDGTDAGHNYSVASNASSFSLDDNARGPTIVINFFLKLGEAFRKTSLARREEIRNHAILSLKKIYMMAEELDLSPANIINAFNLILFAMVDDLHEKMVEYSRRDNAEKEMRSMERTLRLAMELLAEEYLHFLMPLTTTPGFRTFWLGLLRRMDTCMKADLGEHGQTMLQEVVPDLLRKMITRMKEEDILVQREGDDLWETTYIQIQWIAPSLKDELFPEEEL